jgi:hypothetical protein
MLAAEEISKMSKEERLEAIERLWESFSRDGFDILSPAWHEEVLADRETIADSADAKWLNVEELQARLSKR